MVSLASVHRLVLPPAPCPGRLQRRPQPLQLPPLRRHTAPPGPLDASAAVRMPASAAATHTPNYVRPAAAGPPPAADPLRKPPRGLQPHLLAPDPPSGGQATTIRVPHDSAVAPPALPVTRHAGQPPLEQNPDNSISVETSADFGTDQLTYRYGDTVASHIPVREPLTEELTHFLHCVTLGERPLSDGWFGTQVVATLEAADISWRTGGQPVSVNVSGPTSR